MTLLANWNYSRPSWSILLEIYLKLTSVRLQLSQQVRGFSQGTQQWKRPRRHCFLRMIPYLAVLPLSISFCAKMLQVKALLTMTCVWQNSWCRRAWDRHLYSKALRLQLEFHFREISWNSKAYSHWWDPIDASVALTASSVSLRVALETQLILLLRECSHRWAPQLGTSPAPRCFHFLPMHSICSSRFSSNSSLGYPSLTIPWTSVAAPDLASHLATPPISCWCSKR